MSYDFKKYVPRAPGSYDKKLNREWSILDFFLRDNTPYVNARKGDVATVNISILKQFLTELFFLTYFWDPSDVENPLVVIVGSGSGKHYQLLSQLFPMVEFHLYDYVEFEIEGNENIITSNAPFDPSEYENQKVYFISHIKSDDRVNDMKLQEEWISNLNLVKSMIRYDVNYVEYFDGYYLIPPWDNYSYELYLIPTNNLIKRKLDLKIIQRKLWYHYHIVVEYHNYLNIFTNDWTPYNQEKLINTRWDDTWTMSILRDYLVKMSGDDSLDQANSLLQLIQDELSIDIGKGKTN